MVTELKGQVPRTVGLLEQLPGVGRYTAAAIGSIALGQVSRCRHTSIRHVHVSEAALYNHSAFASADV